MGFLGLLALLYHVTADYKGIVTGANLLAAHTLAHKVLYCAYSNKYSAVMSFRYRAYQHWQYYWPPTQLIESLSGMTSQEDLPGRYKKEVAPKDLFVYRST